MVASYSLTLTPTSGDAISVEGIFPVPYDSNTNTYDATFTGNWGVTLCGTYTVSGSVTLTSDNYDPVIGVFEPVTLVCECGDGPGTGTPGYWKNHPEAWPVEEITICSETYTKDEAIAIMMMPVKKDKTYTMFRVLVAAILNVAAGNESSCVVETIAAAEARMCSYGPVGSGVKAGGKNSSWREGEPLYMMLDDYNNGLLCAPLR